MMAKSTLEQLLVLEKPQTIETYCSLLQSLLEEIGATLYLAALGDGFDQLDAAQQFNFFVMLYRIACTARVAFDQLLLLIEQQARTTAENDCEEEDKQ